MGIWQVRLASTVSCLLWALGFLSACTSIPPSPELREIQRTREAAFAENVYQYEAATSEGREVVGLLRDHYRKGHETFNLQLIQAILAPDFEQRYYWTDEFVEIQSREEFLRKRAQWVPRIDETRKLVMSIQEIKADEGRGLYGVSVLTTHRSKYFAPRFLEAFVWRKAGEKWLLQSHVVFPAYPPKPQLNNVGIFVGDYPGGRGPFSIGEEMTRFGPDIVIDRYLEVYGYWRSDGVQRPAVIVFREPVRPGSKVIIHHGPIQGTASVSYNDEVGLPRGSPYFYVRVSGWYMRAPNLCVPFEIEVDDVTIHRETICSK